MARLAVRVTPRAGRNSIDGFDADGTLRLRIAAAPAHGEANAAVIALLAEALGVARSNLSIPVGASSRRKLLHVAGLTIAAIHERLAAWQSASRPP